MKIYNKKKSLPDSSDEEEELYQFEENDEEEDHSNSELNASDIEDVQEDYDIPDQKAWGKQRTQYYDADFIDKDYDTYTKEEEELAFAEEQEAQEIQKRLAQQLQDIDCDLEFSKSFKKDVSDNITNETKLKVDFSNLSHFQKLQIFKKESPEFEGLITDFESNFNSLKEFYIPLLDFAKLKNVDLPIFKILQVRVSITNLYLTNLAFYLYIKVRKMQFKGHPLVKTLSQIKQLLSEVDKKIECVMDQLTKLREKIEQDESICILQSEISKVLNTEAETDFKDNNNSDDDDITDEEISGRRSITYQIAKNKGLTPHRKRENRNPRVKHKMKFRKAIIRRKGAVRNVRKEVKRYDGEISGIKATVRKSIKFK